MTPIEGFRKSGRIHLFAELPVLSIHPTAAIETEIQYVSTEKTQMLMSAIVRTGHRELLDIKMTVSDGQILLAGTVPTFYSKQLAQEAIRPLAIGMKIQNRLCVTDSK